MLHLMDSPVHPESVQVSLVVLNHVENSTTACRDWSSCWGRLDYVVDAPRFFFIPTLAKAPRMPFPVKPCMMKSSSSSEGKVLGAQMRKAFMDLERWWRNDERNTKIAWPPRTSQLWPRAPGWPGYRSNLLGDHERDLPRLVPRDEFSGSHGKARKRKHSRVPRMPYACVSDARPILVAYMAMPKEK